MNRILSFIFIAIVGLFIFYQENPAKFTRIFIVPFFDVEVPTEPVKKSVYDEKKQQYEEEKAKLLGTYSDFIKEKERLESLKKEKKDLYSFDKLDFSIKEKIEAVNNKIREKKEAYLKTKKEIEQKILEMEERYKKVKKSVDDMQNSVEKIREGLKEGQDSLDDFTEAVTPKKEE